LVLYHVIQWRFYVIAPQNSNKGVIIMHRKLYDLSIVPFDGGFSVGLCVDGHCSPKQFATLAEAMAYVQAELQRLGLV
jgi:hypothetical protein